MQKIGLLLIAIVFVFSCNKHQVFQADENASTFVIRINPKKIGDPSRVTKKFIWFWNDTIIIDGVKNGPTKDTVYFNETLDYYGIDSLVIFEKYKASKWFIKQEYYFTSW